MHFAFSAFYLQGFEGVKIISTILGGVTPPVTPPMRGWVCSLTNIPQGPINCDLRYLGRTERNKNMKQKPLTSLESLNTAGVKASSGAALHAVPLGLTVGTKVLIDVDLLGLSTTTAAHLTGRTQLRDQYDLLVEKTTASYDTAIAIRDSLKRSLGRTCSPAWDGSGFNQSLQVPRSVGGLLLLLAALNNYLTEKPELEVENVATAALAGDMLTALTLASGAVTAKRSAVRTSLNARKLKQKKMRQRIRGVAEELNRVLGPLDARWEAFGLNQPGIQQAPDRPGKVTVVLQAGGAAAVKWQKTPRAEYYRLWLKVMGVDEEAIPVGSPTDLDYMIESMPTASGTQVEVSISAVNNGGESARSEVIVVITP